MARIRTVKPEFFSNRGLSACSPHARLFGVGLLTLADKNGNLEWIPMRVHGEVFPWEEQLSVHELLDELAAIDWIRRYQVNGRDYVHIVTFREHQRISGKEAESPAKCPEPVEFSQEQARVLPREAPGCFPEKHLDASPGAPDLPEYLNTGKGKEKGERSSPPARRGARTREAERSRRDADPGFARFWAAYPKKVGKAEAWTEWKRLKPDDALVETMIAAIAAQKLGSKEFVKDPCRWLKHGRWEDEHVAEGNGNGANRRNGSADIEAAYQRWKAEQPGDGTAIDGEWSRE